MAALRPLGRLLPRSGASRAAAAATRSIKMAITPAPPGFNEVIFIETGCARFSQPLCTPLPVSASEQPLACCLMHRAPAAGGTDQHGQDVTKACVRACKDAISWNSIPSLERLVPGGNDNVKLRLQLAVPYGDGDAPPALDMDEIRACFAYGTLQEPVELMPGGARFSSMCSVPSLGDDSRDASWVVAIACVTVGY